MDMKASLYHRSVFTKQCLQQAVSCVFLFMVMLLLAINTVHAASPLDDSQLQAQSVSLLPLVMTNMAEKKRQTACYKLKKQPESLQAAKWQKSCRGVDKSNDLTSASQSDEQREADDTNANLDMVDQPVDASIDTSMLSSDLNEDIQTMLGLGLGSNLADANITAGVSSLEAKVVSSELVSSVIDFQNQQLLNSLNGNDAGSLLVLDEIALNELRKSPYTLLISGDKSDGSGSSSDLSYKGYESLYIYKSVNGRGINDGTDFEIRSISSGPASVTISGR